MALYEMTGESLKAIDPKTFTELGLLERQNIQKALRTVLWGWKSKRTASECSEVRTFPAPVNGMNPYFANTNAVVLGGQFALK